MQIDKLVLQDDGGQLPSYLDGPPKGAELLGLEGAHLMQGLKWAALISR
jgi:hypothetical protein